MDDVAEAGEAEVSVEGREVMLVGPVVFCPCVVLGCVEFAGTDEVKDEVNKGELPVELLLGADSTLLGATELPIVEGSTSEPSTRLFAHALAAMTHQSRRQTRKEWQPLEKSQKVGFVPSPYPRHKIRG